MIRFIIIKNFKSMNVRFYFWLFAILPIYGCFLPVSTMFESAHSLEPGEIKLIVAGSVNPETRSHLPGASITSIMDHGVTSNMDMRYRVERRFEGFEGDIMVGDYTVSSPPYTFFEISPKWSVNSGGFAFALPLQLYAVDGEGSLMFTDPRFIFTKRNKESNFEVTGIIRSQLGVMDGEFVAIPGASIGLGFSEDWDKKSLRMDVGFTSLRSVTFGLGFQTKLK